MVAANFMGRNDLDQQDVFPLITSNILAESADSTPISWKS